MEQQDQPLVIWGLIHKKTKCSQSRKRKRNYYTRSRFRTTWPPCSRKGARSGLAPFIMKSEMFLLQTAMNQVSSNSMCWATNSVSITEHLKYWVAEAHLHLLSNHKKSIWNEIQGSSTRSLTKVSMTTKWLRFRICSTDPRTNWQNSNPLWLHSFPPWTLIRRTFPHSNSQPLLITAEKPANRFCIGPSL